MYLFSIFCLDKEFVPKREFQVSNPVSPPAPYVTSIVKLGPAISSPSFGFSAGISLIISV